MLLQPLADEVGNLGVVLLLKHEVAIALDILLGQVDDRGIAAVSVVLLGKIAALLEHHLPETCRLDVFGTILNVVTKEEQHGNLRGHEFLVGVAAHLRSEATRCSSLTSHDVVLRGPCRKAMGLPFPPAGI